MNALPPIGTQSLFSRIFYVIDVLKPMCNIVAENTPSSLKYLPTQLKPIYLHGGNRKLFRSDNIGSYKTLGNFGGLFTMVSVFCWESTISASKDAAKYYSDFVFEQPTTFQLLQIEDEKYKGFETLTDCVLVERGAVQSLEQAFKQSLEQAFKQGFELSQNQLQEPINETDDVCDLSQKMTRKRTGSSSSGPAKLLVLEVCLYKTQIIQVFGTYINKNFPDFLVMADITDPCNLLNSFTPFHNSSRDLTILRRTQKANEDPKMATMMFPSDSDTDDNTDDTLCGVTFEAKKSMGDRDKYQMLANMEITATCIAKQKLLQSCGEPLKQIHVFGGLIDYNNKSGKIFELTMDFDSGESTVKNSETITSLSCLFHYLISKL